MTLHSGFGTMVTSIALAAACSLAQAQDRPPPPQGMGGPGGMRGHEMMMRMMSSRATMTATDKYVYILRGNTLYQFSADGLKLLGRAELPRPEPREHHEGKPPPRK